MFGGSMGHDWVFDVLKDLKAYALANGLPALAAKAAEALEVAEVEIGPGSGGASDLDEAGREPH